MDEELAAGHFDPGPHREVELPGAAAGFVCQTCGACCSFSKAWPRFTTEEDAEIERIPARLIDPSQSGMGCSGDRCLALAGVVGRATSCTVYDVRPHVCRACEPGDDACLMARARFGL